MTTLTFKCPHCLTEHIALRVLAGVPHPTMGSQAFAHLTCPKCVGPSAAYLQQNSGHLSLQEWLKDNRDLAEHWRVLGFWPAPPKDDIPADLPSDVHRAMKQAESNFRIEGNEEASGTMYRKALDIGLKKIDADIKGTLEKRIDKMVERHLLTPALGQWAHQIRVLGNESAHEEEPPTRDELTALRNFTGLVLQYLFTLPAQVEARKAEAEKAHD